MYNYIRLFCYLIALGLSAQNIPPFGSGSGAGGGGGSGVTSAQLQSNQYLYCAGNSGGAGNAYVCSGLVSSYTQGMVIWFKPDTGNTAGGTNSTLDAGAGAKPINNTSIVANCIAAYGQSAQSAVPLTYQTAGGGTWNLPAYSTPCQGNVVSGSGIWAGGLVARTVATTIAAGLDQLSETGIAIDGSNDVSGVANLSATSVSATGAITSGSGSGVAGTLDLSQGTLPIVATNAISFMAPTSVTSYGLLYPGSAPAAHQITIWGTPASSVSTGVYTTLPNCVDSGGQHLNYTQSSDVFSCGTSGGSGSVAFSGISSGSNTAAAMVVGPGASLTTSGTGTIASTSIIDSNQTNALTVSTTASAVNYLQTTNAATLGDPILAAVGSDTNINLDLRGKGSNGVNVGKNNGSSFFKIFAGANLGTQEAGGQTYFYDETSSSGGNLKIWIYHLSGPGVVQSSDGSFAFRNNTNITGNTTDLNMCRGATGLLYVANTGSCASTASIQAAAYESGGTKFTISGCSAGTTVGGATAGSFLSGTTGACTVVITLNGATGLTAPNGWTCHAADLTTPANLISQSASSTTTCTVTGTTVSGDKIQFLAMAF